jgi:hypothetical protein
VHELATAASVCHKWKETCGRNLRRRTKVTSQDLEALNLKLDQVLDYSPQVDTLNIAAASFQIFQNIKNPENVARMCRQLKAIWLSPILPKTILRTMLTNFQALETLNARLIPSMNNQVRKQSFCYVSHTSLIHVDLGNVAVSFDTSSAELEESRFQWLLQRDR